jgi:hypothetical protein
VSNCNALIAAGFSTDPSDLNVPSIAIGDLPGSQTVKRTVTNVGGSTATYNASVNAPGLNVSVSPSSFTLGAGAKQSLSITIATAGAPLNTYAGGQLTLSDGSHTVRVPLVIRPVALGAPAQVSGTGGGDISYTVKFGYTGPFTATPRGLIPAAVTEGTVADDPTDGACTNAPSANKIPVSVVVPAGTTYARFSLFDADVAPGSDIDLCVFGPVNGSSGSGTSAEEVNFVNPPAGNYTVIVHGWGVPGSSPFKLHAWVLGAADADNMDVAAPASAVSGATGTITLSFTGLTPGVKYLGSVAYSGAAGMPNPTIVRIDR